MKLAVLVALICLIPIVVRAFELGDVARKERARRLKLACSQNNKTTLAFDDADLQNYHRRGEPSPPGPQGPPVASSRDLVQERAFWRKEKARHDRELARLDAQIRRLEWRLAERQARRKPGERLRRDPAEHVLAESIQSLRQERTTLIESFRERARKAGAFPGWLR